MFETLYQAPPRTTASLGLWAPGSQGSHYRCSREGHQLRRVVESASETQIAALTDGEAEFALVLDDPLIVVCSRFGTALPWSGGAFHWHRVPRLERMWPAPPSSLNEGVVLDVALVEADDGRVRASRSVWLAPEFAKVLHEAILEQARFPYDPSDERRALTGLFRRYPSIGCLVANASARTIAA